MSYQQSAGDAKYDGFVEVDTDVIYFYYPIGASSLTFAAVVWNDDRYDNATHISSFGIESVRPDICPVHDNIRNISDLKANEMNACLAPFNLFHEVELLLRCNYTMEDWVDEAELQHIDTTEHNYTDIFNQADFYNGKHISLEYSTFFLQAGLWEVRGS
eukprot:363031_1